MTPLDASPAVSILLPTYNGSRFLGDAIESALNQSFSDFELLISDDGSSDDSFEITEKYAREDKRIRYWKNDSNQGLFDNYNVCISKAKGRFIKPFAQDDVLASNNLEKLTQIMENNPDISIVTTAKHWIDAQGKPVKELRQFPEDRKIAGREVILYNLLRLTNWVGEPSTALFRAEFAGQGFDTEFFHYGDLDYWFQIMEGRSYYYASDILCGFRRHPGAETNRNLKGLLFALDLFRLGRKYRHILSDFGETEDQFNRRTIEIVALNLEHQVTEEGLTLEEMLGTGVGRPLGEDPLRRIEELERIVAGFREVNFHALRYLSTSLAQLDHAKRTRKDELELWQSEMQKLLTSPSWKVTAPLRALKDLLRTAQRS